MKIQNYVNRALLLNAAVISAAGSASAAGTQGASGDSGRAANAPQRPNVIFFLVDDLGWSDIASFGSRFYETPNIDALGRDGVSPMPTRPATSPRRPVRAS